MGESKLSPRLRPIEISYRNDWKSRGRKERPQALDRALELPQKKLAPLARSGLPGALRCLSPEKQTLAKLTSPESCHSDRGCPARVRACRRTWLRRSDGRCHSFCRNHPSAYICRPASRPCPRKSEYQCRSRTHRHRNSSNQIAEHWRRATATTAAVNSAFASSGSAAKQAAFPATAATAASSGRASTSKVCSGLEARCPRRSFQWRSPGWRETRKSETFSQILQEPMRLAWENNASAMPLNRAWSTLGEL